MLLANIIHDYYRIFNYFVYFDNLAKVWVLEMQRPWLVKLMIVITYLGAPYTFLVLTLMLSACLWYRGKLLEGIFLNTSLFSAWAVMVGLKNYFERSRPEGIELTLAGGFSFPSGHAMLSMVFYGFLAILLIRNHRSIKANFAALALSILVLLIGFSRVYLNVHYASDVLAGFLFAILSLIINIKGMLIVQRSLML